MSEWQPIETASPHRQVLLFHPLKKGQPLIYGSFAREGKGATHWMPLPPPPKD